MSEKYPIFSIVGTTAVGKTEFAFKAAEALLATKKYTGVDIISADSRQIYQGLEILSGADIPNRFEKQKDLSISAFNFFEKGDIRLFGISCVKPDENWSVAQFQSYAKPLVDQAFEQHRATIIVGGTGLYHEHIFNTDPTLQIPPNEELRAMAQTLSVEELQQLLEKLDSSRLSQMNNSDRNNPRRLVRALEIAGAGQQSTTHLVDSPYRQIYICLTASLDFIIPKITQRVEKRLTEGVVEEVKVLREKYGERLCEHVITTLGFEHIEQLISGAISPEQAVHDWSLAEKQYAQRQLTWWKAKDLDFTLQIDQNPEWLPQALTYVTNQ